MATLGPGYIYVRRVETLEASHKASMFRETASIVITSLGFLAASLLLFSLVRAVAPAHTPDVGALVRTPQSYAVEHYQDLLLWTGSIFAFALLLAVICSHPVVRRAKIWHSKPILAFRGRAVMDARSSWSRLFDTEVGTTVRAACELDDGSWIDGWVYDLSLIHI